MFLGKWTLVVFLSVIPALAASKSLEVLIKYEASRDHPRSSESESQELEPVSQHAFTLPKWVLGGFKSQNLC